VFSGKAKPWRVSKAVDTFAPMAPKGREILRPLLENTESQYRHPQRDLPVYVVFPVMRTVIRTGLLPAFGLVATLMLVLTLVGCNMGSDIGGPPPGPYVPTAQVWINSHEPQGDIVTAGSVSLWGGVPLAITARPMRLPSDTVRKKSLRHQPLPP
jgi:hypothetical protein